MFEDADFHIYENEDELFSEKDIDQMINDPFHISDVIFIWDKDQPDSLLHFYTIAG